MSWLSLTTIAGCSLLGWLAQQAGGGGAGATASDEAIVETLAKGDLPPVIEALGGAGGKSVGSLTVDALIYLSLALVVAGMILYARKALAERIPDSTGAEADFEAAMLAELMGARAATAAQGEQAHADLAPAGLAPSEDRRTVLDPADALPGGFSLADAAPAAQAASAIVDEVNHLSLGVAAREIGQGPPPAAPDGIPSPPRPTLQEVALQLRRLRSDLETRGPVGNLGGAPGVGLAIAWDQGRHSAVIVADLPPAFALPNLLRRFDAVIVTPPSTASEPIIIDRASNFFLRDVSIG